MPQAVCFGRGSIYRLRWMREAYPPKFLRLKHQVCCEDGIPDYDLRERNIP